MPESYGMSAEEQQKHRQQIAKAAWFKAMLENPYMVEMIASMEKSLENKKKGLNPIDHHDELSKLYLHECALHSFVHNLRRIAGSGAASQSVLDAEKKRLESTIARFNERRASR